MAWAWKSGPVSMTTLWPSQEMRTEGRVRRVGRGGGGQAVDSRSNGLGMEVGAGVDDDVVALPGDEDGGAGAAVARRRRGQAGAWRDGGGADGAVAAERGDAHRGAAAEEGGGW